MIIDAGAATLTRTLRVRLLPSRERLCVTSPPEGEVAPKGRVRGEPLRSPRKSQESA